MFVHPAPGHESGTLTDFLLSSHPEMAHVGSVERPGVVHRLDCDTSGVMVFARTQRAYLALRRAFESHSAVRKTYLAILHGSPKPRSGTLETLIGRKPWDPKRMAVVENGRRAVTHFRVLYRFSSVTVLALELETGRTHQIRVHMAYKGHPVAGDLVYGPSNTPKSLQGQCLHAGLIGFIHPRTGEYLEFTSELPETFQKFLRGLESTRRE